MSDATHGLPIHRPDPDFGRAYGRPGESVPRLALARGWWLMPCLIGGFAGWVMIFRALFF